MIPRARSLAVLARSPDDALPQYRWVWERMVAAWVPALDPWKIVGAGGSIAAVLTTPTNFKATLGPNGETEIVRGEVRGRIRVSPSFLTATNGYAFVSMFRQRTLGNRQTPLAGLTDGTTESSLSFDCSTGDVRRALNPPGAFDSLGFTATTGKKSVAMLQVHNGSQSGYFDGVAGSTFATSTSPTWGATDFVVGSTDGALEMYVRMFASYAIIGRLTVREVQRLDAMTRTLDMFRWTRRRAYSVFPPHTAPTYTIIRPSADVTDGGWLNEAGSNANLYASVDDDPTNDAQYIESPLVETYNLAEIALADPGGLPGTGAGSLTMRHRAVSRRGLATALETL